LRDAAPSAMRAALVSSVVAALSMLLGLARWPSVHWELARAYATASPDARLAIDAVFRGLNLYLGNYVGEFLGELSLNAFFLLSAFATLRAGRRWAGYGGLAVGAVGLIAAFRNVTPAVGLIADVNNHILPLWLVALGVVLLRGRVARRAALPNARVHLRSRRAGGTDPAGALRGSVSCSTPLGITRAGASCAGAGAGGRPRAPRRAPPRARAGSTASTGTGAPARAEGPVDLGACLREVADESDHPAHLQQELRPEARARCLVVRVRLHHVVLGQRREANRPAHRRPRRAAAWTSSHVRVGCSPGSARRSSSSSRCQSGTGTSAGEAARLSQMSSTSRSRWSGGRRRISSRIGRALMPVTSVAAPPGASAPGPADALNSGRATPERPQADVCPKRCPCEA
jgi:hypothetical protein